MTRAVLSPETEASGVHGQPATEPGVARGYNQPQRKPREGSWRAARQGLGLSLRDVEVRTDINRGELSRIERGFGPKPDHALALLRAYGVVE